jgi:N-acyl-phosphatidylethanolamine-hydrolysing phospholipase D
VIDLLALKGAQTQTMRPFRPLRRLNGGLRWGSISNVRNSSHQRVPVSAPSVEAPAAPTNASVVHRMARPLAGAASTMPRRRRIDRSPVAVERPAHHRPDGTFQCPWPSYTEYSPWDYVTRGMLSLRKLDTYPLPLVRVARDDLALPRDSLQTLWIGHATFLVQLCGWNILTDPMMSRRASPVSWLGPARYTPPACPVEDLPPLHFVLLSHSHYDHLDERSVRAILAKEKRDLLTPHPLAGSRRFTGTLWCVPLRLKAVLECFGVPADQIVELDWWDAFTPALHDPTAATSGAGAGGAVPLPTTVPNTLAGVIQRGWHRDADAAAAAELHAAAPTIVCVPAQHHSARTPFDRNNTLWAGFVVLAPAPGPASAASASAASASAAVGTASPSAELSLPGSPVGAVGLSSLGDPPENHHLQQQQQQQQHELVQQQQHLRFYFSGDTGYRSVPEGAAANSAVEASAAVCPAFRDIASLYGPMDLALLPIGAYSPRWFMSSFHCTPEDAVEMHASVQSRRSVAMHWGTFPLTDEPIEEPPERLAAACEAKGVPRGEFVAIRAGSLVSAAHGPIPGSSEVVEGRTAAGLAVAASIEQRALDPPLTFWERLRSYL